MGERGWGQGGVWGLEKLCSPKAKVFFKHINTENETNLVEKLGMFMKINCLLF